MTVSRQHRAPIDTEIPTSTIGVMTIEEMKTRSHRTGTLRAEHSMPDAQGTLYAGGRQTDPKRAVHELAVLEQALDHAVIVAITDVKGRITWANNMFCSLSGYSREELIGRDHNILNSGEHSKQFFRDMYRRIATGKVWRGRDLQQGKGRLALLGRYHNRSGTWRASQAG